MNLVFIEWTDAVGCTDGWSDDMKLEEYNGNAYTCGIVLDENKDWILVCSAVFADESQAQGAVAIPKIMITRRSELEVP